MTDIEKLAHAWLILARKHGHQEGCQDRPCSIAREILGAEVDPIEVNHKHDLAVEIALQVRDLLREPAPVILSSPDVTLADPEE